MILNSTIPGGVAINKAFWGRDGTINRDTVYVGLPDKLEFLLGSARGIRKMNEAGYLLR